MILEIICCIYICLYCRLWVLKSVANYLMKTVGKRSSMRIRIPNLEGKEKYIENKSSIVLIGANGAGKTRMSVWIDENNSKSNIHRISAQK